MLIHRAKLISNSFNPLYLIISCLFVYIRFEDNILCMLSNAVKFSQEIQDVDVEIKVIGKMFPNCPCWG